MRQRIARIVIDAIQRMIVNVCNGLRFQPADATHAANISAGEKKSKLLRGRSLIWRATTLSLTCECTDKSVLFVENGAGVD